MQGPANVLPNTYKWYGCMKVKYQKKNIFVEVILSGYQLAPLCVTFSQSDF